MTPYSLDLKCNRCESQLKIAATRDREERATTALTISCPVCQGDVWAEVPVSITPDSVQVVFFEQPASTG